MKKPLSFRHFSSLTSSKTTTRLVFIVIGLVGVLILTNACVASHGSQPNEVYKDAFDTNQGWQLSTDASATINIGDGVLTIEVHTPGQVAWSAHQSTWKNIQLSVVTEQIAGPLDNEYGVLIRMENDTSFYVFSISSDGYARAALYQNASWTVLGADWTPYPIINQGLNTNTLTVKAVDSTLALSVNGEAVLEVEDVTLDKGMIGLYAGAFGEGGVVIAFDDLEVSPLP
jgi:hypothetical protein